MNIHKEYLDAVLVPIGLLTMLIYHIYLLYSYFNRPLSTAMGYENKDKKIWVGKILQLQGKDVSENVDRGLSVISSSTSASMNLGTISLTLCSLIGSWMGNSTDNFFPKEMIYGNTSSQIISIKYVFLLTCFLLAFSCFVQSARHFIHSNYLLSTPGVADEKYVKRVEKAILRATEFWALGVRALYFALSFLLWFFGPIPMLVSSVIMVVILCCHDFNSEPDNQKDG